MIIELFFHATKGFRFLIYPGQPMWYAIIIRFPLNAGELAVVHVFVSVSGTPFFGGAAGRPTVHLTCGLSGRTICPGQHALFRGSARHISCPGRSLSGRWVAVSIATNFWDGAFIPWVIGDLCF